MVQIRVRHFVHNCVRFFDVRIFALTYLLLNFARIAERFETVGKYLSGYHIR